MRALLQWRAVSHGAIAAGRFAEGTRGAGAEIETEKAPAVHPPAVPGVARIAVLHLRAAAGAMPAFRVPSVEAGRRWRNHRGCRAGENPRRAASRGTRERTPATRRRIECEEAAFETMRDSDGRATRRFLGTSSRGTSSLAHAGDAGTGRGTGSGFPNCARLQARGVAQICNLCGVRPSRARDSARTNLASETAARRTDCKSVLRGTAGGTPTQLNAHRSLRRIASEHLRPPFAQRFIRGATGGTNSIPSPTSRMRRCR